MVQPPPTPRVLRRPHPSAGRAGSLRSPPGPSNRWSLKLEGLRTHRGGSLIEWAFKAYASGNWTVSQLHDELTSRGLVSLPTPKRPSKPLAVSSVHRLLTNPYYKGDVVYRGTGPYPRFLDTGCDYAAVGSVAARRAS
ncbi:recombinase family protein [Janibacter indicus]|uniref:recombinase family protein n=1 Tax=Janibacter indicus TaxID=857417 RepID=UPI001CF31C03|nr:recombinase family protein [Janibacter indicus]